MDLTAGAKDLEGVPNTSLASDYEDDDLVPDISDAVEEEGVASSEPAEEDLTVGLSLTECVEKANVHKAEGNDHFKASRSCEAVACYSLGVRYLTKHLLEAEARPVLVALHTNSAACHIREEAWGKAIAAANSSVEIDLTNKALYRRGVAYARLGQLDEAKDDLATVCRADAKNREARAELAAVSATLKARKEEERKAYGSMFSGRSMYREEELREKRKLEEERQTKERGRQAEAKLKQVRPCWTTPGPGPSPEPSSMPRRGCTRRTHGKVCRRTHGKVYRQGMTRVQACSRKLKYARARARARPPSPSPSPPAEPEPEP